MRKALQRAAQGLGLAKGRCRISAFDRQRIVSMIDAGCDYASIRSELGFRGFEIDWVLRQHTETDR